jgi:glyoxylase-like metal-dependent hydrolase (beta-lactamase superfamily II)
MTRYLMAAMTLWLFATGASAQGAPERGIVNVTGDLYRAQNNQHFTVFLVTSDGIILSDPINREFSEWLRAELERRFDVPVRYVLYSHHHWDHASGGEVFADTAEFVGHRAMAGALAMPAMRALEGPVRGMDANGNGTIERAEAGGNLAAQFDLHDEDGNGSLSGAEIARGPLADVYPAESGFDERRTVTLGGSAVEMIHIGPNHAPDMTVLRFPAERAVFIVDILSPKRLPFRNLPGYDHEATIATIERIETLDFDTAIGGHGDIGTKEDVAAQRRYLLELHDAVADGIAAGRSLDQLRAGITMDDYSDWGSYDWLPLNIEGMYNALTAR